MAIKKTFKLKRYSQLDNVEKEWRPTLNTNTVNHAVKVERTQDKVVVTTEDGSVLTFVFES